MNGSDIVIRRGSVVELKSAEIGVPQIMRYVVLHWSKHKVIGCRLQPMYNRCFDRYHTIPISISTGSAYITLYPDPEEIQTFDMDLVDKVQLDFIGFGKYHQLVVLISEMFGGTFQFSQMAGKYRYTDGLNFIRTISTEYQHDTIQNGTTVVVEPIVAITENDIAYDDTTDTLVESSSTEHEDNTTNMVVEESSPTDHEDTIDTVVSGLYRFIEDKCELGSQNKVLVADFLREYREYCAEHNIPHGTIIHTKIRLREIGIEFIGNNEQNESEFVGISLRNNAKQIILVPKEIPINIIEPLGKSAIGMTFNEIIRKGRRIKAQRGNKIRDTYSISAYQTVFTADMYEKLVHLSQRKWGDVIGYQSASIISDLKIGIFGYEKQHKKKGKGVE